MATDVFQQHSTDSQKGTRLEAQVQQIARTEPEARLQENLHMETLALHVPSQFRAALPLFL